MVTENNIEQSLVKAKTLKKVVDKINGDVASVSYDLGNLENKMELAIAKKYVTPEQYGALGNGVHDDSIALQTALDSSRLVTGILGKTYNMNGNTINIGSDTILENISIINGTINVKEGSRFVELDRVNVNCNNIMDYGIKSESSVPKLTLNNCYVSNSNVSGYYLFECWDIILNNCSATSNNNIGYYLNEGNSSRMYKCLAYYNKTGIVLEDCKGGSFDCTIQENTNQGIVILGCFGITLDLYAEQNGYLGETEIEKSQCYITKGGPVNDISWNVQVNGYFNGGLESDMVSGPGIYVDWGTGIRINSVFVRQDLDIRLTGNSKDVGYTIAKSPTSKNHIHSNSLSAYPIETGLIDDEFINNSDNPVKNKTIYNKFYGFTDQWFERNSSKNIFDGIIENGEYDQNGKPSYGTTVKRNSNQIRVKPSTTYYVTDNGVPKSVNIFVYDRNGYYLYRNNDNHFNTNAVAYYVNISAGSLSDKIMISESNTNIYEPYYEEKYVPNHELIEYIGQNVQLEEKLEQFIVTDTTFDTELIIGKALSTNKKIIEQSNWKMFVFEVPYNMSIYTVASDLPAYFTIGIYDKEVIDSKLIQSFYKNPDNGRNDLPTSDSKVSVYMGQKIVICSTSGVFSFKIRSEYKKSDSYITGSGAYMQGDIVYTSDVYGLVLTASNGNKYRLKVSNTGELSTIPL